MPIGSSTRRPLLPCDAVPALAAYGLRLLRSAYGGGNYILVRRASDDTTLAVGDDGRGGLDIVSLETFCAGTDGFITTWYDQSGNGTNLVNATPATQPQIVSSGSVLKYGGIPAALFVGDFLDATLSSAITDDAHSLCLMAKTENPTIAVQCTFRNTGKQSIYEIGSNDSGSHLHTQGALSSARTGDRAEREQMQSRLEYSIVVGASGGNISFYRNGEFLELETVAEYGNSTDAFRLGNSNASHTFRCAELLIYGSSLTASQVSLVSASSNDAFGLRGPKQISVPDFACRMPWDSTLIDWLRDVDPAELEVTGGSYSYAGDYIDQDDLYRMWQVFFTTSDTANWGLLADVGWFRFLAGTDGRGMFDAAYVSPMVFRARGAACGQWAAQYAHSMTKSGGEANPFFGQRAVAMRALVQVMALLIEVEVRIDRSSYFSNVEFIGGAYLAPVYVLRECGHLLPKHVYNAAIEAIQYGVLRLSQLPAHGVNANMDMKAIAFLAQAYDLVDATHKQLCIDECKVILFGSSSGTPDTSNITTGTFDSGGWIVEGSEGTTGSPELTYIGHSQYYLAEAWAYRKNEAAWAFIGEVLTRICKWISYQDFREPDGLLDGPSGYCGRTGGGVEYLQGNSNRWKNCVLAAEFTDARPRLTVVSEASMVTDITNRQTGWSANSNKNPIVHSGSAAAHTSGVASTTVQLTDSPTLSTDENTAGLASSLWLWMNVSGQWSYARVRTVDNTAKTVLVAVTEFNVPSGAPVDYKLVIGPKEWDGGFDANWPADMPYLPVDGSYASHKALQDSSDDSLLSPWQRAATFNENFNDRCWAYKSASGGRQFGWWVGCWDNPGTYNGWYGGTLETFWTDSTGIVILCKHDKSGSDVPQLENTRVWSLIDSWAACHIWGIDSTDLAFSSAVSDNVTWTTAVDTVSDPKTVSASRTFTAASTKGKETGTALAADFTITQEYESLSDGIQLTYSWACDGTDTAKELWASIPIYIGKTATTAPKRTVIEYWNGSAWTTLSTSLVTTSNIRLTRDFGTAAHVWIEFATPQSVKLSAAEWIQSYQGTSNCRNLKIDLLGYTGSAQSLPTSTSVTATIRVTDPGL